MEEKIVLLGATWCGNCGAVKMMFEQKGINYEYIDVDTPVGMEYADVWKVRSLPSAVINGNLVVGQKAILEVV